MASFKFKPLSTQKIHLQFFDADGEKIAERISQIGEYLDIEIPAGGVIEMSEYIEVISEDEAEEIPGNELDQAASDVDA